MKRFLMPLFVWALTITLLAGLPGGLALPVQAAAERAEFTSSEVQFQRPREGDLVATISTSLGDIKIVFFPEYAPLAVNNFTTLASTGYYDNTVFHRVVEDFVVQGGDPTGTGTGGESRWGIPFRTEAKPALRHYSGAVCFAAAGATDTHQSQFYIVATPQGNLTQESYAIMRVAGVSEAIIDTYNRAGGAPWLDNTDTVFAQVYEGMEVVDAIAAVATDNDDRPKNDVVFHSVVVDRIPYETPPEPVDEPAPEGEGAPVEGEPVEGEPVETPPEEGTAE